MKDYKSRSSTLYLRERKSRGPRIVLALLVVLVAAAAAVAYFSDFPVISPQAQPEATRPSSDGGTAIPLPLPPAPPAAADQPQ